MTNITYACDSTPPWSVSIPAALQQLSVVTPTLVFPLLVADAAGLDAGATVTLLDLTMIAFGLGCLLQPWQRFGIGCGYLLPACCTGAYIVPVLHAARTGGMGAVAGMTIVAGLTTIVLSRFVRRLRPFLPTEIMGLVVLLLGLMIGLLGFREMGGTRAQGAMQSVDIASAFTALACIVVISVWGAPRLRSAAVIMSVVIGTVMDFGLRLALDAGLPEVPIDGLLLHGWPFAIPTFDLSLAPGFLLGAVVSLLRATGDVVICQRANDPHWHRTDYKSVAGGTLADGLSTLLSGLLGGMPINTASAGAGLAATTGVLSRKVCQLTGVLWLALGVVPGGAGLILAVPRAVFGASLLYSGAFLVVSGMAIITARLLDARRAFTIGAAFIGGLSFDLAPSTFAHLPTMAQFLVPSSLLLALIVALLLNAVFRIGSTRTTVLSWHPGDGTEAISQFVTESGGRWGARVEPILAAERALNEFAEAASVLVEPAASVDIAASFDEFSLDFRLRWPGHALPAARPLRFEDADDTLFVAQIAAGLMQHRCDRMTRGVARDGRQELSLHFDH